MNARLKTAWNGYLRYWLFLAWSVGCVIVGIVLMWFAAVATCTVAFR